MEDPVLANIRRTILTNIPPEARLKRIEFEGPYVVIYVENPSFLVQNSFSMKNIAKILKKRIIIKVDPSARLKPEEARRKILSMLSPDAGVGEKDIVFDDVLGEVIIKADRPGLVIGDDGKMLKQILIETGWRPKVARKTEIESRLLDGILNYMIRESDYRIKILRSFGERIHRSVFFKNNYVRMTALGGFREVGRSSILVETAESKILLDFGLNPGISTPPNMYPRIDLAGVRLDEIDAVIITHAHVDHCGLVPMLFKFGYEGPIYATEATRDLMVLLQLDILDIARREGKPLPFTQREVQKMVLHTIPIKIGETTDISSDIKLTFYNAGHILGSAMAHLHIGNGFYNILYTGDMKFQKTLLLDRSDYRFPRVDSLIMESTYGATVLMDRREAEAKLIATIAETIKNGGKVLIPTLSVGRAQEIMLIIRNAMIEKKLEEVPVYIEGMIDEVTSIHMRYPELLSKETFAMFKAGEKPFVHPAFKIVKDRSAIYDIVESREPSIIMATSGMLTGGPAVEYFKHLAPDPRNTLIFVNYQVQGTLGRRVKDGEKEISLPDENGKIRVIKVAMRIESIEGFSGHSDRNQLLSFLRQMQPKPKRIILNHGEPQAIEALAKAIRREKPVPSGTEILIPSVLDSISFKVG